MSTSIKEALGAVREAVAGIAAERERTVESLRDSVWQLENVTAPKVWALLDAVEAHASDRRVLKAARDLRKHMGKRP